MPNVERVYDEEFDKKRGYIVRFKGMTVGEIKRVTENEPYEYRIRCERGHDIDYAIPFHPADTEVEVYRLVPLEIGRDYY